MNGIETDLTLERKQHADEIVWLEAKLKQSIGEITKLEDEVLAEFDANDEKRIKELCAGTKPGEGNNLHAGGPSPSPFSPPEL